MDFSIYFKIGQDITAKIFLIDFETSKLPNDVKALGELVKTTLVELKINRLVVHFLNELQILNI